MKLTYETDRLLLKILRPTPENAMAVLDFYNRNQLLFERYEAKRPENFYTAEYQNAVLSCEYNLTLRLQSLRFWIYEKDQPDVIIGTVCFYNITHSIYDCCKTGYKFDQNYQGRGYAKEAMQFGIAMMFEQLHLHRIEAYVMKDNAPSIHLLMALNFEYEGTCRKVIRICDTWEDHMLFSLLK